MSRFRNLGVLAGLFIMAAWLSGCPMNTTTGTTPPSPAQAFQQPVLNSAKLLADACNGAVKSVIQLRNQGQINPVDARTVEDYCKVGAMLSDSITTEIQSTDSLAVQKTKLITITTAAVFPVVNNTQVGSLLSNVTALVLQIRSQITGGQ